MKKLRYYSYVLFLSILMTACGEMEERDTGEAEERRVTPETSELQDMEQQNKVGQSYEDMSLSQKRRDALSPDEVVMEFQQGNERFIRDSLTPRDRQRRIQETGTAQFPKGMVLSCIDSRVPVEEIFDQGLGDIFVGRIAGNFADEEMLGSLEYATEVAGSKVIVVLGHEGCGAVKSAIDGVALGNITNMLEHVKPAVEMTDNFAEEERTVKNEEYVNAVVRNNVLHTVEEIRSDSDLIAALEDDQRVKILGAVYKVSDGTVEFL